MAEGDLKPAATYRPATGADRVLLKRGMQPTHELMAEWILQNPSGTLKEMGEYFGYGSSWLSQVINTDMFRAHMAERMKDIQGYVQMDIPMKMQHLANLAIERVKEVLEKEQDSERVVDTFDKVMHRFGYAPNARNAVQPQGPHAPAPGNFQQNNFFLSKEDLSKAREILVSSHAPEVPALSPPEEPKNGDDK